MGWPDIEISGLTRPTSALEPGVFSAETTATTEVLLAVNRQGQSLCAADHPTSLRDHLVLFGPASEVQASQRSKHVKASERSYPWLDFFFLWENIG